jgi:hypothetical protein
MHVQSAGNGSLVWLVWWVGWNAAGVHSDYYLEAVVLTAADAKRVRRRLKDQWNRKLAARDFPHTDRFVSVDVFTEKRRVGGARVR